MATADLDTIIRQLAKQQQKALTAAIKARRAHYTGLAAKAGDAEAKARFKQLAADALEHGAAAAKRLQMSADNIADSYARAMRKAAEAPVAAPVAKAAKPDAKPKPVKKVAAEKPVKKRGEEDRCSGQEITGQSCEEKGEGLIR